MMRRLLLLSVIWLLAAQERAVFNSYPSWSPDGSHIVFSSDRGGNTDLYVIGADGRGLRQLTVHDSIDSHPTWSQMAR